jgi:hypothetical protein
MICRHCHKILSSVFLDLGFAPVSNEYLSESDLTRPESWLPLKLYVCENCWLVQTEDYADAKDLFNENYAYFSSTSTSWLEHARQYADMIRSRLSLTEKSLVVEIAANDGYLLKNFMRLGIPCLGIEPTKSTALAAEAIGIAIIHDFFSEPLANHLVKSGQQADLIVGNNVYAHVPDINDFTCALRVALKAGGTITLEFPHLLRLIEGAQFDTVYHEHFSYLALGTVQRIFKESGLRVWDVETLSTHGGSLRVYGCHADDTRPTRQAVDSIIQDEIKSGLQHIDTYKKFQSKAESIKIELLQFLIEQKLNNKQVAAYGAAAKGNTLLNFAGIRPDLLPYVCDAALSKQGMYLPGSHIPIVSPALLTERRPDCVLILPWNLTHEVQDQQKHIRGWGAKFVTAIPTLRILA